MTHKGPISDELLNAFVDNQLDADEKSRLLEAVNRDPELGRRACELKQMREMIHHAYENPPMPPHYGGYRRHGGGNWMQGAAAGVLLGIGGLLGWFAHTQVQNGEAQVQAMYLDTEKAFQRAGLTVNEALQINRKFLLHISSADPVKIAQALDTAEQLLSNAGSNIDLEIIANAGGLGLLRADVSPFADRVRDLQVRFHSIAFLACQNAINRLQREWHIKADLLPGTRITPSAQEQILNRLREGWVYISV